LYAFFLGNSLASEFYMSTFRNTLFYLHKRIGMIGIRLWRWDRVFRNLDI